MTKVYQIYFNAFTKEFIFPTSIPYNNEWYDGKEKQPAFENHIIREIFENNKHIDSEKIGILSWACGRKHNNVDLNKISTISSSDVLTYNWGYYTHYNIWEAAEFSHPGILKVSNLIFKRLGININLKELTTPIIYENAHITKTYIYERYVNELLIPVLDIMSDLSDSEIYSEIIKNSNYYNHFNSKHVLNLTGFPHYTFHTFICERLFSTFLSLNNQYTIERI